MIGIGNMGGRIGQREVWIALQGGPLDHDMADMDRVPRNEAVVPLIDGETELREPGGGLERPLRARTGTESEIRVNQRDRRFGRGIGPFQRAVAAPVRG